MNATLATNEQILAFLATSKKRVQDHSTVPSELDKTLRALKTVRYETEKGLLSFEVESYKGSRIAKSTGKEVATFQIKGGEYRSLFTAQIQF